jgi:N-acetylglutamate synthase-like GNAT family acetyltransferase
MIRKAEIKDLEQVYALYKEYSLDISRVGQPSYDTKIQKSGFTLDLTSRDELKDRISSSTLFLVYELAGKIVAYIDINKEIYFPEKAENIVWFNKGLEREYFHGSKSTVLHYVVVSKNYRNKGIAKELLGNALKALKKKGFKSIFAIITIGSITNCRSVIFHTKAGFTPACITLPIDLFGLKNYQSLLLYRKI